jgi:hypothetical protein
MRSKDIKMASTEPSPSGGRSLGRRLAIKLEQIGDVVHAVKDVSQRRLSARNSQMD